ncbi:MAG: hypothetical protein KF811_10840 [Dokdonella sp.]|nr:hypothetical protein [Dokdonella sp.]
MSGLLYLIIMDTDFGFVTGVALRRESMGRLRQRLEHHRGAARDCDPQHSLPGARPVGDQRTPRSRSGGRPRMRKRFGEDH